MSFELSQGLKTVCSSIIMGLAALCPEAALLAPWAATMPAKVHFPSESVRLADSKTLDWI